MPKYGKVEYEADLQLIAEVRAEVNRKVVRAGYVRQLNRDASLLTGAAYDNAIALRDRLLCEGTLEGFAAQEAYTKLDAMENGYVCHTCRIVIDKNGAIVHREMEHTVVTGCTLRYRNIARAAAERHTRSSRTTFPNTVVTDSHGVRLHTAAAQVA